MPEGPSLIILKEAIQHFKGKKIIEVTGNSKEDIQLLAGQKITDIKTWGKNLLLCFKKFIVRIHLMMFGSYSVNEKSKTKKVRLGLHFKSGDLYFYSCVVKFIQEDLNGLYDWSADVMNPSWSAIKAKRKLKKEPGVLVCDALLNQQVFAGVGNIIKNEVCFRIFVHPESTVGALPPKQINALVKEAKNYSFDFLEWKKAFVLKKHWLIYTKKKCPRCNLPAIKNYSGITKRRTFFCNNCQVLYK